MGTRQEVLNAELARLLNQQGLVALPEQRLKQGAMPDLLLPFRGLYLRSRARWTTNRRQIDGRGRKR